MRTVIKLLFTVQVPWVRITQDNAEAVGMVTMTASVTSSSMIVCSNTAGPTHWNSRPLDLKTNSDLNISKRKFNHFC